MNLFSGNFLWIFELKSVKSWTRQFARQRKILLLLEKIPSGVSPSKEPSAFLHQWLQAPFLDVPKSSYFSWGNRNTQKLGVPASKWSWALQVVVTSCKALFVISLLISHFVFFFSLLSWLQSSKKMHVNNNEIQELFIYVLNVEDYY